MYHYYIVYTNYIHECTWLLSPLVDIIITPCYSHLNGLYYTSYKLSSYTTVTIDNNNATANNNYVTINNNNTSYY